MEPFLGQVNVFGFNFAPRGWAKCDGQILPINQNQSLYSLLGTTYGGDGRTSFALPDLRGRSIMGFGDGSGLTDRSLGAKVGVENNNMTVAQMPGHTHNYAIPVSTAAAATDEVNDAYITTQPNATYAAAPANNQYYGNGEETLPTGASSDINNMQPFQVVNMCIALQGLFPSRN